MFKRLGLVVVLLLSAGVARAAYDDEPRVSTEPIGSSYYRHLAQATGVDLRELIKFERRGFGRTEINVLILISTGSLQTLKDYGNRRLKDRVPLNDLIKEAHRDVDEVYAKARELKTTIETLGDNDLPPPVYEVAASTSTVKKTKQKKSKEKQQQEPLDVPKPTPEQPY